MCTEPAVLPSGGPGQIRGVHRVRKQTGEHLARLACKAVRLSSLATTTRTLAYNKHTPLHYTHHRPFLCIVLFISKCCGYRRLSANGFSLFRLPWRVTKGELYVGF